MKRTQSAEERAKASKRLIDHNPNRNAPPWKNSKSAHTQEVWKVADKIYEIWKKTGFGYYRISSLIRCKNRKTINNMILRFKKGWDPVNDQDWLDFSLNTPKSLAYSEKLDRLLNRRNL